jgi:abhydrolase domain-containing protein 17
MKVLNAILLVLVAYAGVALFAFVFAERVMFQPPPSSYGPGELPVVHVPAGSDSVAVLHLPNDTARYTILYSHGNAEDLGHLVTLLRELRDAGFGVLAFDYRGYGLSSDVRPTAWRAVEDAESVYTYAVESLGIEPDRLLLYGRSIGAGPALEVAANYDAAGVILESAFTSAYRVMTRVAVLPFDRFSNIRHVRELDVPLLVIHGTADAVIPPAHGRQLYAAAPGLKQAFWVEGAGHNDLGLVAGPRYYEALRDFVRMLDASRHGDGDTGPGQGTR